MNATEPETAAVQTTKVEKGTVAPTLAVTGYLSSTDERQVNSNSAGEVVEVRVTVGDTVTAGEELLKLDTSGAQQNVNVTYAGLTSAQARLQELRDQDASAAQIASQDAAVARARVDYNNAVDSRAAAVISSPINGTVIAVNARVGDQVSGGSGGGGSAQGASQGSGVTSGGLITIADLDNLQVESAIDQADISQVIVGQTVEVTLDALANKKFTGEVAFIDPIPSTNQNVVTYTARVSIDELDVGMRLGMSANLEITLESQKDVLFVSNVAIRTRGDRQFVSKLINGQPTEVPVKTGLIADDRTEIVSGLTEGDEIVVQSFTASDSEGVAGGSPFRGGFGGGFGGPRR
jgi:macrolide-specific efflux system membrane fusion protein